MESLEAKKISKEEEQSLERTVLYCHQSHHSGTYTPSNLKTTRSFFLSSQLLCTWCFHCFLRMCQHIFKFWPSMLVSFWPHPYQLWLTSTRTRLSLELEMKSTMLRLSSLEDLMVNSLKFQSRSLLLVMLSKSNKEMWSQLIAFSWKKWILEWMRAFTVLLTMLKKLLPKDMTNIME